VAERGSRAKQPEPEVEVEKTVDQVHTETEIAAGKQEAAEAEAEQHDMSLPEYVESLVALFFGQQVQALEQRISDLELLVGQPEGAVRIYDAHDAPLPSQYVAPDYQSATEQGGGVPWYQRGDRDE
jgi:hypothetical protein